MHIYPLFLDFLPIYVTAEPWVQSPLLYSSFSLVTYFTHSIDCVSVPNSQCIISLLPPFAVHACVLCPCVSVSASQTSSSYHFSRFHINCVNIRGFPGGSDGKASCLPMQETPVRSLGREDAFFPFVTCFTTSEGWTLGPSMSLRISPLLGWALISCLFCTLQASSLGWGCGRFRTPPDQWRLSHTPAGGSAPLKATGKL